MAKVTNLANVGESVGHAELCERFYDFLLKTRKQNLARDLMGDDEFSCDLVGGNFADFEQDLTDGLQLTPHDQLRIQARVRNILKSSGSNED